VSSNTLKDAPHYDAERTRVVNVPPELAEHIGVFKDMIEVVTDGDNEQVLLQVRRAMSHWPVAR
jgi:hypothetical protein